MIEYFYLTHRRDPNRYYRVKVDLGVIAMNGYSPFPNARDWSLHIGWSSVIYRTLIGGVIPSAEKQSVYSTAPADWAVVLWFQIINNKNQ